MSAKRKRFPRRKKNRNSNGNDTTTEELFDGIAVLSESFLISSIENHSLNTNLTLEGNPQKEMDRNRDESVSTIDDVIIIPTPAPETIEIDSENETATHEIQVTVILKEDKLKSSTQNGTESFFEDRNNDNSAVMAIPMYSMVSDTSLAITDVTSTNPNRNERENQNVNLAHDETKEEGEITSSTIAPELDQECSFIQSLESLNPPEPSSSKTHDFDNSVVFVWEKKAESVEFISIIDSDNDNQPPPKRRKKNPIKRKSASTTSPNTQIGKRMIILDGNNVAINHSTAHRVFSAEGLNIAIEFFKKLGHEVKAVVPQYRQKLNKSSNPELLKKLSSKGHILWSPCKNLPGNTCSSYDDR